MSKRVQVLGIEIDNHTVRETMFLLEEYAGSEGLNLAGVILPELLVAASENKEIQDIVEMMELRVIGDVSIMEVLEKTYEQQAAELQRRDLEEVFLNSLIRKKKTVYWVSDAEEDLEVLGAYMREHYPKLNIAGHFTGAIDEEQIESLLNDVNSVAPDVILFQTAAVEKLGLLMQYKNQLNAKLCVYMGYRVRSKYWSPNRSSKIKNLIDQTMFKRKAMRYQMNKEL